MPNKYDDDIDEYDFVSCIDLDARRPSTTCHTNTTRMPFPMHNSYVLIGYDMIHHSVNQKGQPSLEEINTIRDCNIRNTNTS